MKPNSGRARVSPGFMSDVEAYRQRYLLYAGLGGDITVEVACGIVIRIYSLLSGSDIA